MKPTLILLLLLSSATMLRAQILNGDFEEWGVHDPTNWSVDPVHSDVKWTGHTGKFSIRYRLILNGNFGPQRELMRSGVIPNRGFRVLPSSTGLSFWYIAKDSNNIIATVSYSIIRDNTPVTPDTTLLLRTTVNWKKITLTFPTTYNADLLSNDTITIVFGVKFVAQGGNHGIDFWVDDVEFDTNSLRVNTDILTWKSFSISPNPISSHAHLNLHLENPASIHAALFDITGRKVLDLPSLESAHGDEAIPFDVDEIPNGMYYLRCEIGGNIITEKLIVNH